MAKNYCIQVGEMFAADGRHVVVRTMLEATSLACTNLSKDRQVTINRTAMPHTHSTSAAAQAFIDVELFALEGEGA